MQSHILVSLSKRAQCKIAIRIITNTVRSEIRQQKKTQFPASLFARTPILIRVHFSCSMCVVRCVCLVFFLFNVDPYAMSNWYSMHKKCNR